MAALSAATLALVGSITLTSPPNSGTVGTALSLAGTVAPATTAVEVGLSSSATVAPTSFVNATVSGLGWTATLTPASAGTFYIWAQQTNAPNVAAVSGAVTIAVAGTVTFTSPPSSESTSASVSLAGTVSNSGAAVQVGWSSSASTPPTSWTSATVSGTGWTATVTAPGTAGTYYLWAEETANTSIYAVTSAITVSAGGATLTWTQISSTDSGDVNVTTSNVDQTAVNMTTLIGPSASVTPSLTLGLPGGASVSSGPTFWFDTSATNQSSTGGTVVSGTVQSAEGLPGGYLAVFAGGTGPASAGTYYGKVSVTTTGTDAATYVFVSQAITVT